MRQVFRNGCASLALVAGIVVSSAFAGPLGTSFTYQGQLKKSGASVNGPADLIFTLHSDPAAVSQVGPTLTFDGVGGNPAPANVTGGLFQVELNFGAGVFTGSDLYLDVQARVPAGAGAYTPVGPRQKITAAPYALFALNTGVTGNTLDQAYDQGGPGAGRIINADAGGVQINGSGGFNVGTVFNVNPGTPFVGINRTSRVTTSEYFGVTAPVNSSFGGMYMNTTGEGGQPFYGYAVGGVGRAYHYFDPGNVADTEDDTWKLNVGGERIVVSRATGNVGIGDTTPEVKLDVVATDTDAISGTTTAAFSYGVYGSGTSAGVYGTSSASNGAGVEGVNNVSGGAGVSGSSSAAGGSGVSGTANNGTGVYGQSFNGYGIYGSNGGSNVSGYAGYFNGRVHVAGTLSKSGGTFKIDHPLDPANKTLSHSFVESPERMNVYNGTIVLDDAGKATVSLPNWFSALNKDFRYQLTAIGGPGPNLHIAKEIENNSFAIAGGQPGLKVSWQVTGVRQDAWAKANPLEVEEDKPAAERGTYLNPELFVNP